MQLPGMDQARKSTAHEEEQYSTPRPQNKSDICFRNHVKLEKPITSTNTIILAA
jgi:hypothetical protein